MGNITRTVLLVDDDKLILEEMKTMVNWEELGFQVIATAYNGKRALELYQKYSPNLVITDIVMPIMDGLDLVTNIRKLSSDTHILIITAYDEFEYAKKALQHGVADYILKTDIVTDAFHEKLAELHTKIDKQQQRIRRTLCMELYNYFVSESIDSIPSPQWEKKYHFFLLTQKQSLHKHRQFPPSVSVDSLCRNFDEFERLKLPSGLVAFTLQIDFYKIIAVQILVSSEAAPSFVRHIGASLASYADQTRSGTHTVYYNSSRFTCAEFRTFFYNHRQLLDFFAFFPESSLMDFQNITSNKVIPSQVNLCYAPLNLEADARTAYENKLFSHVLHLFKTCNIEYIENFFEGFCYHYESLLGNTELFDEIINVDSDIALASWFQDAFHALTDAYLRSETANYSQLVHQTIQVIRSHYNDPDLSIESLAASVSVSAGYLGNLFKRETGKTINTYLTDVRIDAAISLLKNTNLKVYDIAEKVGYRSAQYFSQVFYRKTQRKPLDMHKSFTNKSETEYHE